jgi:hypothetical protein
MYQCQPLDTIIYYADVVVLIHYWIGIIMLAQQNNDRWDKNIVFGITLFLLLLVIYVDRIPPIGIV